MMRTPEAILGVSVLLMLTTACDSDPTGPTRDESAPLQTNTLAYAAVLSQTTGSFEVTFDYRNPTNEVRWLSRGCHGQMGVVLQRRSWDWEDAWDPDCPRIGTPPIEVPAGGTYSETVVISGALPGFSENPAHLVPQPGRYRALVVAWTDWSFDPANEGPPDGALAPLDERVSNEFDVVW